MSPQRVVAALSGGVDSSVAAALLVEAGYEVVGVNARLWSTQYKPDHPCCGEEAVRDARAVCVALKISFYVLDLEAEFRRYVVDYFAAEHRRGRTPNPCIACNQCLKFGFLLEHASALKADFLATGHYARASYREGAWRLLRAAHVEKDQSYVLYTLDQERLKRILFPLGDLGKPEVRRIAREKGLPVSEKPDSQDLCFLFDDVEDVPGTAGLPPGDIVDSHGKVLGHHKGIGRYTIGQRTGLGITTAERVYVTRIEPETNRVVVGPPEDLLHRKLIASSVKWVSGQAPVTVTEITAKIRYKSPEAKAILHSLPPSSVELHFAEPQRAITPGQAVVFYLGDEVLGGGTIESAPD